MHAKLEVSDAALLKALVALGSKHTGTLTTTWVSQSAFGDGRVDHACTATSLYATCASLWMGSSTCRVFSVNWLGYSASVTYVIREVVDVAGGLGCLAWLEVVRHHVRLLAHRSLCGGMRVRSCTK